jgi:hypothetical protein
MLPIRLYTLRSCKRQLNHLSWFLAGGFRDVNFTILIFFVVFRSFCYQLIVGLVLSCLYLRNDGIGRLLIPRGDAIGVQPNRQKRYRQKVDGWVYQPSRGLVLKSG